jgi:very-short-patch-repair endonuclease
MCIQDLIKNKNYKSISLYLRHNPKERNFLLNETNYIKDNQSISNNELVYIIVNNLKELPKCTCGLKLEYVKPKVGYKKTCGNNDCIIKSSSQKRKETNQKLYGGNSPANSKIVRDKMVKTIKDRYGVDKIQSIPGVKEKTINSNKEKYGSEWSSQSELIKQKSKEKLLKKYGVDCTQKINSIKEKTKKTNKEKYGSEEFFGSKEIRDKINKTFDERYGGHPLRNEDIKNKIKETSLKEWGETHPTKNILVKEKISNALTKKWLSDIQLSDSNFIKKDEDGYYVLFCEKEQKEYKINPVTYNRRKRNGEEISIYLNPLNKSYSKGENELSDYIESIYFGTLSRNNRDILGSYELDIVLEDLKICIEYNGLYFHSDNFKPKNYHINKFLKCQEKGYRLIQIWEDEWYNEKDKIMSYIGHVLGTSNKIYARKCEIRWISDLEYKTFCEINHLQNYAKAKHRLGLIYEGEIVSIMGFSKPRVKSKEFVEYEMIRFCNKLNYSVIGSASKLFNFFVKNIKPTSILTYSDLDKFDSNLYQSLGFNFQKITEPSYFYFDGLERINRFKLRKSNIEKHNLDINKFNKVYTCGNKKWVWHNF